MIEEYKFGSITIDGKTYTKDVEVRWDDEVLDWWRQESHVIDVADIGRALLQEPEVIVVGTGEDGMAEVTDRAREAAELQGVKLIVDKTPEAVKTFNVRKEDSIEEEGEEERIIGLFHLTC